MSGDPYCTIHGMLPCGCWTRARIGLPVEVVHYGHYGDRPGWWTPQNPLVYQAPDPADVTRAIRGPVGKPRKIPSRWWR